MSPHRGEYEASALGCRILLSAAAGLKLGRGGDRLAEGRRDILEARRGDAGLTLDAVAAELGAHWSTLFRRFRERLRMSPTKYLRDVRLVGALGAIVPGRRAHR